MTDVQDNVLRFFAIDHVLVSFVTIAPTGAIVSLQFIKNRLEAGLRPDPFMGELERSPRRARPSSHKTGPTSKGRREGREEERKRDEGKGQEGKGKEGRGNGPLTQIRGSAPAQNAREKTFLAGSGVA